jgi:hypothetical protein
VWKSRSLAAAAAKETTGHEARQGTDRAAATRWKAKGGHPAYALALQMLPLCWDEDDCAFPPHGWEGTLRLLKPPNALQTTGIVSSILLAGRTAVNHPKSQSCANIYRFCANRIGVRPISNWSTIQRASAHTEGRDPRRTPARGGSRKVFGPRTLTPALSQRERGRRKLDPTVGEPRA